jgi:hypothetical protein
MAKIISTNTNADKNRKPCRMAYTVGHKQPVLCTLLANDPFFFDIDPEAFAEDIDDNIALDGASFNVPEALRTARETSDGFITLGDDDESLLLTDDLAAICHTALSPAAVLDIDAAVSLLTLSSTGRLLWEQAGVSAVCDASVCGARFDSQARLVRINPTLDAEDAALALSRELRRAVLAPVTEMLKNPDSAIVINRAMQAELLTVPVQVAWELNMAGNRGIWERLSRSTLSDLVYAYGHRASTDFRALRDGRAAMAAFDQWFYSGRTRRADRGLIQSLLALGDQIAAQPRSAIATIEALRAIGERGIGRNYLTDHIMNLMQDGFYADVRDRSNANFLWFVKFERSYRAAEAHVEGETKAVMPKNGAVILAFPDLFAKRAKKSGKSARR